MLMRFRVRNFRSIKDEQELSLIASTLSEHPEAVVHPESYGFGVLRCAAVYGPNASGKSTLCYALRFMRSAVTDSHRSWEPEGGVPRQPFVLDPASRSAPSLFGIDFLKDGVRYEYGFVANSSHVLEEWLFAYPRGRRQEWFTRDANRADEFNFSRSLTGENRTIVSLTRPNSLFLSAAAQNNHEMLSPIHTWIAQKITVVDHQSRTSLPSTIILRCRDDVFRQRVFSILAAADLGISDIRLVKGQSLGDLRRSWGRGVGRFGSDPLYLQLLHHAEGDADVPMPFHEESAGTQTLFSLAGVIVDALTTGGIVVVDELDRSLHPHLALEIVEMFNDPETNPNNAQLIFNTHDTNLLDNELLRRDQIWFTEKDDDGATHLYPLTDFRARKHENLERGYLQGRYGAVPAVGTPDVLQSTGA